jgi:RHS repeat-associated protein
MSRLVGMTDGNNATVATAQYDGNSQLSELDWGGLREVRQYNQLQQLTRMTTTQPQQGTTWMDMQYIYVAGANNGRVTQTIDGVTGDTQAFGYDALNRLVSVTSSLGNNESMAYDGFGNLTSMNGVSYTVDATTNRRTGGDGTTTYDANGNVTQWGQAGYGWDIENRMTSNGAVYDPWGKRVGVGTQVYFYSLSGQRLTGPNGVNRYFGGKLIQSNGVAVATDRLGSVRANGNGERMVYKAYGAERTSTADGREKFGTYFRDGTGLDYADQRYYGDTGRFLSVDPGGMLTAALANPTSWNRYAYSLGDPINRIDSGGLYSCFLGELGCSADPTDPCTPEYAASLAGSAANPACAEYGPEEAPPPPPPNLTCTLGPAVFYPVPRDPQDSENGLGWYANSGFYFSASGGTGPYTWSEVQFVAATGYAIVNGNRIPWSNVAIDSPLPTRKSPSGSQYVVMDMPGMPAVWSNTGPVSAGQLNYNFLLMVSVTDASGDVVNCSPINWSAEIKVQNYKGSGTGSQP